MKQEMIDATALLVTLYQQKEELEKRATPQIDENKTYEIQTNNGTFEEAFEAMKFIRELQIKAQIEVEATIKLIKTIENTIAIKPHKEPFIINNQLCATLVLIGDTFGTHRIKTNIKEPFIHIFNKNTRDQIIKRIPTDKLNQLPDNQELVLDSTNELSQKELRSLKNWVQRYTENAKK